MFLNTEQEQLLSTMSNIVTQTYYKNGKKYTAKMILLGENIVKLESCVYNISKIGSAFLMLSFTRKPTDIIGYKTKILFAPHTEVIFNYERAKELCKAFEWDLKEKPSEMPFNDYFKHVYRRVNTFIGRELKVSVSYYKELRKDEYGFNAQEIVYYDLTKDIIDWRAKVVFYNINEQIYLDWCDISSNFVSK